MSVHDETWDKCSHCRETVTDGYRDYHEKGYCLKYSYEEYLNLKNEYTATPLGPFYGCDIADPKYHNLGSQQYIPEMMAFEKDFVLCDLKLVIEAGLEYAQECIIRHDLELGRTTRKNESWAKIMEKDIAQMKQVLGRITQYENP